jgi:hypothetical protein
MEVLNRLVPSLELLFIPDIPVGNGIRFKQEIAFKEEVPPAYTITFAYTVRMRRPGNLCHRTVSDKRTDQEIRITRDIIGDREIAREPYSLLDSDIPHPIDPAGRVCRECIEVPQPCVIRGPFILVGGYAPAVHNLIKSGKEEAAVVYEKSVVFPGVSSHR